MSVDAGAVAQIAAWLAATDIAELRLTGPGTCLHLRRRGGAVERVEAALPGVTVHAPSAGIFLHRHPLRADPFVQLGGLVAQGDCLGLLRIGTLLLPVVSPSAGRVAGHWAEDGKRVGYGEPLLELHLSAE